MIHSSEPTEAPHATAIPRTTILTGVDLPGALVQVAAIAVALVSPTASFASMHS